MKIIEILVTLLVIGMVAGIIWSFDNIELWFKILLICVEALMFGTIYFTCGEGDE